MLQSRGARWSEKLVGGTAAVHWATWRDDRYAFLGWLAALWRRAEESVGRDRQESVHPTEARSRVRLERLEVESVVPLLS